MLAVALLVGCGGADVATAPPASDAGPARVVIVAAVNHGVYVDGEHITVTLRNDGGAGFFKLGASATASSIPNGPLEDYGASEPFEVSAGWSETADFSIQTGHREVTKHVGKLTVYSRGRESLSYTVTSEFKFPN
jgi:hypothetical protein